MRHDCVFKITITLNNFALAKKKKNRAVAETPNSFIHSPKLKVI